MKSFDNLWRYSVHNIAYHRNACYDGNGLIEKLYTISIDIPTSHYSCILIHYHVIPTLCKGEEHSKKKSHKY